MIVGRQPGTRVMTVSLWLETGQSRTYQLISGAPGRTPAVPRITAAIGASGGTPWFCADDGPGLRHAAHATRCEYWRLHQRRVIR